MTNNNENIPTLHFPKEITDLLTLISEQQTAQIRLCRTLLAGFKATREQDVYYMDHLMDPLMDFMDQGDETEDLYRDYLAHIASFDAQEGQKRLDDLEEHLGYWAKPSMPQHTWQSCFMMDNKTRMERTISKNMFTRQDPPLSLGNSKLQDFFTQPQRKANIPY